MWYIFGILVFGSGNATYGGPIVIDGFKNEKACIEHVEVLKRNTPKEFNRNLIFSNVAVKYEYINCIEKKTE